MPRRGECIYKKENRWEARYQKGRDENGRLIYGSVYAHSYQAVKTKRAKLLLALQVSEAKEQEPKQVLFQSILDEWLFSIGLKVKESSFVRYHNLVENHIAPQLGAYPIEQITNPILDKTIAYYLEDGRLDCSGGLSNSMVMDIVSVIKRILRYASDNGTQLPCNPALISVKRMDTQIRVLSTEEASKLTSFLSRDMDACKFGILLCLYSGLRLGEICALKWCDFRFDDSSAVVHVHATLQRIPNLDHEYDTKTKVIITAPKSSHSIREIPLPDFVASAARHMYRSEDAYVLSGTTRYMEPRTLQKRFSKITGDIGIHDVNFHALRHTFATYCIASGVDIKTLSEIMGHSNVNITLNRYVHSDMETKKRNMKKIKCPV